METGPVSPYKKFQQRNAQYIPYVQMKDLVKHKPYSITNIIPTDHVKFGKGQLAFIRDGTGNQARVQIPSKYLQSLTLPDDIDFMLTDIREKQNPFLVVREHMVDNSYKINIIGKDLPCYDEAIEIFKQDTIIPEFDDDGNFIKKQQAPRKRSAPSKDEGLEDSPAKKSKEEDDG